MAPFSRYTVPSGSMEPSIEPGDHILAYRDAFDSSGPKRGDLIVVHPPGHGDTIVRGAASRPGVHCRPLHEPYLTRGR